MLVLAVICILFKPINILSYIKPHNTSARSYESFLRHAVILASFAFTPDI